MTQEMDTSSVFARTHRGGERRVEKSDLDRFRRELEGVVRTPQSADYDGVRSVWNGMVNTEPAVIASCSGAEDVVETVRFAANEELAVSIKAGGHNVAGTALEDHGLVVDLSPMRQIEVDPAARVARIQGGATLADVDDATQRYGLMVPSGFVSQTGLGGLLLRGGLGHSMRRLGLTCDQLRAVDLVTSDGRELHVSAEEDPQLFWALRGGPVDLGVVTAFEVKLYPLDREVRMLFSLYPSEKGTEINRLLRDAMRGAPRELGLISVYVTVPNEQGFPKAARGREVIALFGMYTGRESDADEVLSPFLDRADLIEDLGGWMPYKKGQQMLDEDYPEGRRYYWKSLYFDDLSDGLLGELHKWGTRRPSPNSTLDVWVMGGAIQDVHPRTSSFPHRDANYMVAIEANWDDPSDDAANVDWARKTFEALWPYSNGGLYLNFAGSREEHEAAAQTLFAPSAQRLQAVKERVDPIGLFGPALGRSRAK